ncbi:MAG: hypothetical protein ACI8SC_001330 [Colwellia sp.]|jgi:hypothetical protein
MLKGRKPLDASSIKIMKVGDKDLSDIEGRKIGDIHKLLIKPYFFTMVK